MTKPKSIINWSIWAYFSNAHWYSVQYRWLQYTWPKVIHNMHTSFSFPFSKLSCCKCLPHFTYIGSWIFTPYHWLQFYSFRPENDSQNQYVLFHCFIVYAYRIQSKTLSSNFHHLWQHLHPVIIFQFPFLKSGFLFCYRNSYSTLATSLNLLLSWHSNSGILTSYKLDTKPSVWSSLDYVYLSTT